MFTQQLTADINVSTLYFMTSVKICRKVELLMVEIW